MTASATDMIPTNGEDEPLLHGGDLGAARRLFPGAPEPFIDLSTGINPNPYPVPRFSAELFARLPALPPPTRSRWRPHAHTALDRRRIRIRAGDSNFAAPCRRSGPCRTRRHF